MKGGKFNAHDPESFKSLVKAGIMEEVKKMMGPGGGGSKGGYGNKSGMSGSRGGGGSRCIRGSRGNGGSRGSCGSGSSR